MTRAVGGRRPTGPVPPRTKLQSAGGDLRCIAGSCMGLPAPPELICMSANRHSVTPWSCTGGLVQETSWGLFLAIPSLGYEEISEELRF